MADEIAVPDEPLGRSCLGLPFVGQRPLTERERRRAERRLARRRILWVSRTAALGIVGATLLFWLFPETRLDFYRDSELSLLALGGGACLGGALIAFRGLGREVKNLRLDLTDGRVERYERKLAPESATTVVGQASILPRSRLEVGLGGRRLRIENLPLSEPKSFEKAALAPLRHPLPPSGESRPLTELERAELEQRHTHLVRRLTKIGLYLAAFLLYLLWSSPEGKTLFLAVSSVLFVGWLPTLLAARRLRADRRAGVVLRARNGESSAVEWEILPHSRFLWTEQGKTARWRSEPRGEPSEILDSASIGAPDPTPKTSLGERIGKAWRRIRPALWSPRALWAVLPLGCLAYSIAAFWAMPGDPTPSQLGAPFLWGVATFFAGFWLFGYLEEVSNEPVASAAESEESSVPCAEKPTPTTSEAFRRKLLPSERDQVAKLMSSHEISAAGAAWPVLGVGWIVAQGSQHPDRWWLLGLALFVLAAPLLVSGLQNVWVALRLRDDLRKGEVIAGRSASETGEIEWLARSHFPWTEDGEPVAWRRE